MYSDEDRRKDFEYYKTNISQLYKDYGHCFLAIKDGKILGHDTILTNLIASIEKYYPFGDYIVQECDADESAYTASIMRLIIHA